MSIKENNSHVPVSTTGEKHKCDDKTHHHTKTKAILNRLSKATGHAVQQTMWNN